MIRAGAVQYEIGDFVLDVTLEVADDEYFVLLGATGSGKTLFLECLCGLHTVRSGTVTVGGRDVTTADPGARRVGYVPQDGALFTHLNVLDNIAFGLKVRGHKRERRERRASELAEMLGIGPLLGRRIRGLSGGERQRVALARAVACDPAALLLDEPVSALDEFTRDAVCRELVKLQRRTGVSVVHVCHSFDEARLVADRIGIIGAGRLVQTGTPDDLVRLPANRYVANLLRLENVFAGTAKPELNGSMIEVDGLTLHGPEADGPVELVVRPWDIRVAGCDAAPGVNDAEGKIVEFNLAGALATVRIDGPLPLVLHVPRGAALADNLAEGRAVRVTFDRDAIHILGAHQARGGGCGRKRQPAC